MPVQAVPQAIRMAFQFQAEIEAPDGALDTFLLESVDMPATELATADYASGGMPHTIKIAAGIEAYGDLTLKLYNRHNEDNSWGRAWLLRAVDEVTLQMGDPADYKRDITINLLNHDSDPVEQHTFEGCFVKSVKVDELNSTTKDKVMTTVVLSVDRRLDNA
jgi:phage tail-like protein